MKVQKWSQYEQGEKLGIIGAGIVVLGSAFLIANSYRRQVKIDWEQIPVVGYDYSGNPILWSPQQLANELADNLQGYNLFTYPETVRKINVLRNEQTKLLWNYFNRYKVETGGNLLNRLILSEGRTLTSLIESEWTDWGGDYERAISKFKSLGLY